MVTLWSVNHDTLPEQISDASKCINFCIRAHPSAIRDLGWHPSRPNVFFSAAIQSPVKLWDIRDPITSIQSHPYFHKNTCLATWEYSETVTHLAVGSTDASLKVLAEDEDVSQRFIPHLGPIWDMSISTYLGAIVSVSDDGTVCANFLGLYNKRRPCTNCILLKLKKRPDNTLEIGFPCKTTQFQTKEVNAVSTFPDRKVGWRSVAWSSHVESCNWIACGSNVGLLCIIPFTESIPVHKIFKRE